MADLLYSGGPCSGRHQTVPDTFTASRLNCGGIDYTIFRVERENWLALPPGRSPGPTTVAPTARKAGHAWARLVHGVVTRVPADARRSARARQVLLRIARR